MPKPISSARNEQFQAFAKISRRNRAEDGRRYVEKLKAQKHPSGKTIEEETDSV